MGQVLHGSATTTEAVRRAIQHSQASLRTLAKRFGVNQKTVAKWRKRESVSDLPTGPKVPKSTVLTVEEEAIIVAFRRHTLLPLDDCLYSLQVEPLSAIGSRPMARDPTSEPLVAAPLSATPRHLASAGRHRRRGPEEEVQGLSDRLLPQRHRRGPDCRREAPSLRSH